jgi:hypothetical protein
LAARSRKLRELHGLEPNVILRETFSMPLHAAPLQARKIIDEHPAGRYMKIVETWRQLSDGQIEFTVRRLPTAD